MVEIQKTVTTEVVNKVKDRYTLLGKVLTAGPIETREVLRLSYEFADYHNKMIHPENVCKTGCAHCCRLSVDLLGQEAVYISDMTGAKITSNPQKKYKSDDHSYCPFLDQEAGTCTIYEYRPMTCRNFLAMDSPDFCWPPNQRHIIVSLENSWGSRMLGMLMATLLINLEGIDFRHKQELPSLLDIRDYFTTGDIA